MKDDTIIYKLTILATYTGNVEICSIVAHKCFTEDGVPLEYIQKLEKIRINMLNVRKKLHQAMETHKLNGDTTSQIDGEKVYQECINQWQDNFQSLLDAIDYVTQNFSSHLYDNPIHKRAFEALKNLKIP